MDKGRVVWRVLGITGLTLTVVGAVVWGVAKGAVDREQGYYWFTHTFSNGAGTADDSALRTATIGQWAGVAALIVGVGLLVTVSIVLAVTAHDRVDARSARRWFDLAEAHERTSTTELADLVALHDRGALTDDEFSAAKRRMLGL